MPKCEVRLRLCNVVGAVLHFDLVPEVRQRGRPQEPTKGKTDPRRVLEDTPLPAAGLASGRSSTSCEPALSSHLDREQPQREVPKAQQPPMCTVSSTHRPAGRAGLDGCLKRQNHLKSDDRRARRMREANFLTRIKRRCLEYRRTRDGGSTFGGLQETHGVKRPTSKGIHQSPTMAPSTCGTYQAEGCSRNCWSTNQWRPASL